MRRYGRSVAEKGSGSQGGWWVCCGCAAGCGWGRIPFRVQCVDWDGSGLVCLFCFALLWGRGRRTAQGLDRTGLERCFWLRTRHVGGVRSSSNSGVMEHTPNSYPLAARTCTTPRHKRPALHWLAQKQRSLSLSLSDSVRTHVAGMTRCVLQRYASQVVRLWPHQPARYETSRHLAGLGMSHSASRLAPLQSTAPLAPLRPMAAAARHMRWSCSRRSAAAKQAAQREALHTACLSRTAARHVVRGVGPGHVTR